MHTSCTCWWVGAAVSAYAGCAGVGSSCCSAARSAVFVVMRCMCFCYSWFWGAGLALFACYNIMHVPLHSTAFLGIGLFSNSQWGAKCVMLMGLQQQLLPCAQCCCCAYWLLLRLSYGIRTTPIAMCCTQSAISTGQLLVLQHKQCTANALVGIPYVCT